MRIKIRNVTLPNTISKLSLIKKEVHSLSIKCDKETINCRNGKSIFRGILKVNECMNQWPELRLFYDSRLSLNPLHYFMDITKSQFHPKKTPTNAQTDTTTLKCNRQTQNTFSEHLKNHNRTETKKNMIIDKRLPLSYDIKMLDL